MDKEKNKISDTDSFWDQLDTNQQGKGEATSSAVSPSPFAAEKSDGSIVMDRDQLLRAVGQLTQHPLEEEVSSRHHIDALNRETAQRSEKEERDVFSQKSERSASVKERKKSSRPQQRKEKNMAPAGERIKDGSVSMSRNTVLAIVAAAVVCLGSFLGIFYKLNADKQAILSYIETELADIRAKNDAAIAEMGETLGRMETNFDEIVSLLEETGAAIGSSSQESRAAISERIEKLDKQLQSLQKSLAVLQEDANGRKK